MDEIKTASRVTLSPRIGLFLTQVTDVSDPEAALWKVLSDYIDIKVAQLTAEIQAFEAKWGMTFDEFAERCEAGTLDRDPYAYEVESDYWEWEAAETLLHHYQGFHLNR